MGNSPHYFIRQSLMLPLLVVLLAFALRVYRLDYFPLRGDESFTVLFVQKPLEQMWHEILTIEPNPPLLYFALRVWITLVGAGEWVTRYFSLFFGVLSVALVYRLARDLSPQRRGVVGEVAAFLVAINPYQIWHSQDVRNYTLWPALNLLALVLFWQWYAHSKGNHKGLFLQVGFVWAELAALYTHYYEAFILLALNLFVFATLWRNRQKIVPWLGMQLILALLYLPYPLWLSNRVAQYGEGSGRQGVALWDLARETFTAFTLGETLDETWRAWLWIAFALLALTGLIWLFARDWRRGVFFWLYLAVPTCAVFGLNLFRPLYLERYLSGIAPGYYVLVAFGIGAWMARAPQLASVGRLTRWNVGTKAIAGTTLTFCSVLALVALMHYWHNPAFAKAPDWRGLANIIITHAQRGDIIVQNFPETSLLYYTYRRVSNASQLADASLPPLVVYPETFLPDAKTMQALNALNANYQRVWFVPAAPDFWDPEHFVEQWLNYRGDLLDEWQVRDLRLRLYALAPLYLNTLRKVDADFADVLYLLGYRAERRGDALRVVFYWRARASPQQNYVVRVQALDANAQLLAAQESIPVRGARPTTVWRKNDLVVDQHDLPNAANAVRLKIGVCDVATGECLPVGTDVSSTPTARRRAVGAGQQPAPTMGNVRVGAELILALAP